MLPSEGAQPIVFRQWTDEVNATFCKKPNGEYYILFYYDEDRQQALTQIGRWASDGELSFTWYDAAMLSSHIRKQAAQKESRRC
jgi:hypothetical protein